MYHNLRFGFVTVSIFSNFRISFSEARSWHGVVIGSYLTDNRQFLLWTWESVASEMNLGCALATSTTLLGR